MYKSLTDVLFCMTQRVFYATNTLGIQFHIYTCSCVKIHSFKGHVLLVIFSLMSCQRLQCICCLFCFVLYVVDIGRTFAQSLGDEQFFLPSPHEKFGV